MSRNIQISQKGSEKIQTSRRDLTKINEESFNHDLNKNLEIDIEKTLQQNYNNYTDAIKKKMDKHAPLKTKTKTKKDHNSWFNKDSQKTQNSMKDG